jgi:hypothetical protein
VRDITKSLFSLSWALSLLGFKQITDLVTSRDPRQLTKSAAALDPVVRAAVDQLDDNSRMTFRAGDDLLKGMTDLMFSFLAMGGPDASRLSQMTSNMFRCAASAPSTDARGQASRGPQEKTGWGPVPAPETN